MASLTRSRPLIVAVDGPAASGKGTIASGLALHYQLPYLDTGSLYRAVGLGVISAGLDPLDERIAAEVAARLRPEEIDPDAIRTPAAGEAASVVAAQPLVRAALKDLQVRFAMQPGGAVLDGRDIGTVIAPFAHAKLFVTAEPAVRAKRRHRQHQGDGQSIAFDEVLADIARRDERDAGRGAAPLARAEDAVLLDTTHLTIEAAADAARRIVEAARDRGAS